MTKHHVHICDRCGKAKQTNGYDLPKRWKTVKGGHICGGCKQDYRDNMEEFMEEKPEEDKSQKDDEGGNSE